MLSNAEEMDSMDIVTCEDVVASSPVALVFCYTIVIAALCHNLYFFTRFVRSIRDIMIRQRAPWIAVVQSVSYFSVVAIPFFIELLLKGGVLQWETDNESEITSPRQIPLSRIVLKTLLGLFRLNIAIIIPYR